MEGNNTMKARISHYSKYLPLAAVVGTTIFTGVAGARYYKNEIERRRDGVVKASASMLMKTLIGDTPMNTNATLKAHGSEIGEMKVAQQVIAEAKAIEETAAKETKTSQQIEAEAKKIEARALTMP